MYSNLKNMSPSYRHDDDKLNHGAAAAAVTHSVPIAAAAIPPAEPKSKRSKLTSPNTSQIRCCYCYENRFFPSLFCILLENF